MKFQRMRSFFWKLAKQLLPDLIYVENYKDRFKGRMIEAVKDKTARIFPNCLLHKAIIGRYTYISENASISYTEIGNFCSIGPNFLCGWGFHPLNGISTSPMFYSSQKQNGCTLSETDKIEERKKIIIGNDVFIGMNVTVLDGVTIGDGAVIGAGSVVTKDVPPYTIAAGNPMQFIRKRFDEATIESMLAIKWWFWDDSRLKIIEKEFFTPEEFARNVINNPESFKTNS